MMEACIIKCRTITAMAFTQECITTTTVNNIALVLIIQIRIIINNPIIKKVDRDQITLQIDNRLTVCSRITRVSIL